jgi:glutamyl-tRNA synthetase
MNVIKNRSKTLLELMGSLLLFKREVKQEIPLERQKANKIQEFILSVNENQNLHDEFKAFLEKNGLKFKDVGPAFRAMLIGCTSSIGIFEIISVLGFDEAKNRVLSFKNFG